MRGCGRHAAAVLLLFLAGCHSSSRQNQLAEGLALGPQDRVLILAPHPDDEVIGCGGIIQKAVAQHLPLRIVFLTHGDNNQWSFVLDRKHVVLAPSALKAMGLKRCAEALAAARALGADTNDLIFLGYPDRGTLAIWNAHWGDQPPYHSLLTRAITVPYANAFRPGAPHKGEEMLRDLTAVISEFRPTKIFVSHPADHNPDHRALYLFTRVALWNLETRMRPALYPYLVHFKRWPRLRGSAREGPLVPPSFFDGEIAWVSSPVQPAEENTKAAAIKKHHTQYLYSAAYLLSFIRENEVFGDFPDVTLAAATPRASVAFSGQEFAGPEAPPAELTEQERDLFTGIEWRSAQLDGENLVLAVKLSRPLAKAVEASFDVFGYRSDGPFALMPKIHARVGIVEQRLLDQTREIPDERWAVERSAREIVLRVPTRLLGDPQRVLVSARTYLGDVPLDWVSWRVLNLPSPSRP